MITETAAAAWKAMTGQPPEPAKSMAPLDIVTRTRQDAAACKDLVNDLAKALGSAETESKKKNEWEKYTKRLSDEKAEQERLEKEAVEKAEAKDA